MSQREQEIERRRIELEALGPQDLLRLAKEYGIILHNGPFVIDQILQTDFPELNHRSENEEDAEL